MRARLFLACCLTVALVGAAAAALMSDSEPTTIGGPVDVVPTEAASPDAPAPDTPAGPPPGQDVPADPAEAADEVAPGVVQVQPDGGAADIGSSSGTPVVCPADSGCLDLGPVQVVTVGDAGHVDLTVVAADGTSTVSVDDVRQAHEDLIVLADEVTGVNHRAYVGVFDVAGQGNATDIVLVLPTPDGSARVIHTGPQVAVVVEASTAAITVTWQVDDPTVPACCPVEATAGVTVRFAAGEPVVDQRAGVAG